jgi:hypothetical protein
MKHFNYLFFSLFFLFNACSKDSDDTPAPGPQTQTNEQKIQAHHWRLVDTQITLYLDSNGDGLSEGFLSDTTTFSDSCQVNVNYYFKPTGYLVYESNSINPCGYQIDSSLVTFINDSTILNPAPPYDTLHIIEVTGNSLRLKLYLIGSPPFAAVGVEHFVYP